MTICRSIHGTAKALFHSILRLSSIPLYICATSSLFIRQWTFRLLPCLSYCQQCCYEKTLMLEKIEDRRRRGRQRMRWLSGIINSMGMSLSKLWGIVKNGEAWQAAVHWVPKSQIQLSNWTSTWMPGEQQAFRIWDSFPPLQTCPFTLWCSFAFAFWWTSGLSIRSFASITSSSHVSLSKMPFYFYTLWNLLNIIINETFFSQRKWFKIIWTHEIKSKLDSK